MLEALVEARPTANDALLALADASQVLARSPKCSSPTLSESLSGPSQTSSLEPLSWHKAGVG